MSSRVVLAYSGGLDTSVIIHWLKAERDMRVVAFSADLGQGEELEPLREKAVKTGAEGIHIRDLREEFVHDFIFPALRANATYQSGYPLHTALGRPLIAKELVRVAREEKCDSVAHGCTGKGNDQVRFETGVAALAPDLKVLAPLREWDMKTREDEIDYAVKHEIPIPITRSKPYSLDRNLWGCAIECGELEDPWNAPPEDAYQMTANPLEAPDKPDEVVVGFEAGLPVSLDGKPMGGVELIEKLNEVAGVHGVGRLDMVEDRVVGIKSREIYENPAAAVLLAARQGLQELAVSKPVRQVQDILSAQYADLIYTGRWFTDLRGTLDAFFAEAQKYVTGEARVRLFKGAVAVLGRKAPWSLYDEKLATYGAGDTFRHTSAEGFLDIYSLPVRAEGARRVKAGS